jgi:hypothetical protein
MRDLAHGAAPARRAARHGALLVVLALAACSTSAGGPEYLEIGATVGSPSGSVSEEACTPVPVMPGAQTARDLPLGGARVHLEATRDLVTVTWWGAFARDNTPDLRIQRSALIGGYSNDVLLEDANGAFWALGLRAPCQTP